MMIGSGIWGLFLSEELRWCRPIMRERSTVLPIELEFNYSDAYHINLGNKRVLPDIFIVRATQEAKSGINNLAGLGRAIDPNLLFEAQPCGSKAFFNNWFRNAHPNR